MNKNLENSKFLDFANEERKNLVLYGAGEMGGQFACLYRDLNLFHEYNLKGFVDDNKKGSYCGFPILGKFDSFRELLNEGIDHVFVSLFFDAGKRLDKCLELEAMGYKFPSLTQFPKEGERYFPEESQIGKGLLIYGSADFNGISFDIGDFAVISSHAVIDHSTIGKGSIINPHTFMSYGSKIGDGSMMYPYSSINRGSTVGSRCVIYPYVLVHKDLPDGTVKTKSDNGN